MRTLCWSFTEDAPGVCDVRTGSTYADVDRPGVDGDAVKDRLVAVPAAVHRLRRQAQPLCGPHWRPVGVVAEVSGLDLSGADTRRDGSNRSVSRGNWFQPSPAHCSPRQCSLGRLPAGRGGDGGRRRGGDGPGRTGWERGGGSRAQPHPGRCHPNDRCPVRALSGRSTPAVGEWRRRCG